MPRGGTAQRKLTDPQKLALASSAQVAITIEQLGGSPGGEPTTTPIYVVPLRSTAS
jgi:anti-sigma-K factor RskA